MEDKRIFWKKVWVWLRYDAKYLHKEIYRGIKNLIYWFPIIWKDRDWDQRYIYEILETKIEKQARYIDKYGHHVNAKRDAEVMMTCVRLMKKVSDGYYLSEMNEYHKTKMEFIPIEGSTNFSAKFTEKHNNFEDYFVKYPTAYKKVLATAKFEDSERIKYSIASEIATYNQNKAHKLLFKIVEKNIENGGIKKHPN
nr:hypothetical protein [uncultured Flavobacterium sp.]